MYMDVYMYILYVYVFKILCKPLGISIVLVRGPL